MPAPKAITKPDNGKKPSGELSLEAAAKVLERKSKNIKRKQQALKDGDSGFVIVPFYYADGSIRAIRVTAYDQRVMNIDRQDKGKVEAEGNRLIGFNANHRTKSIKVSFGRARKEIKSGKYKGKKRLVQAWKELSVPADANNLDILFWIKSFKKQPGLVKIGDQIFVLDSVKARAAAGAVR